MEYSKVKREIIGLLNERLFWGIGMMFGVIPLLMFFDEIFKDSPTFLLFSIFLSVVTVVWFYVCIYKLSMSVEPKLSLAVLMMVLQVIPFLGLPSLISLSRKAWKISHGGPQVATD